MFYTGQKVACVHDLRGNRNEVLPKAGQTYTIRAVLKYGDLFGLLLEEIVNPPVDWAKYGCPEFGVTEPAWNSVCFRPLVEPKTDISVFERALRGEPVHV